MKKIALMLLLPLAMAVTMIGGQTTEVGTTNTKDMSLRLVYTTSYGEAEKVLPGIVRSNFSNDWNRVELSTPSIQDEISKFVSSEEGRMAGVDKSQIRQQVEAAFSAALFQLKHNPSSTIK